ncbi:MAG: hypothetical protein B7X58_11355, partial [Marinobacter sp. 34-60-7]
MSVWFVVLAAALAATFVLAVRAMRQSAQAQQALAERDQQAAVMASEANAYQQRIDQQQTTLAAMEQRLAEQNAEINRLSMDLREQQVALNSERRTANEKLELLEKNRDALKQEFENLANRIFDQKSERFSQQSKTSLDSLLNPF